MIESFLRCSKCLSQNSRCAVAPEEGTGSEREFCKALLDTRPSVAEPEAEAARVADVVLVPVRPSPDDIEAVADSLVMLRRIGKRAVLVVNAAKTERRGTEARAALGKFGTFVCPHHVTDRAVFQDAALAGLGVSEMRGPSANAATAELRAVWKWVEEMAAHE